MCCWVWFTHTWLRGHSEIWVGTLGKLSLAFFPCKSPSFSSLTWFHSFRLFWPNRLLFSISAPSKTMYSAWTTFSPGREAMNTGNLLVQLSSSPPLSLSSPSDSVCSAQSLIHWGICFLYYVWGLYLFSVGSPQVRSYSCKTWKFLFVV